MNIRLLKKLWRRRRSNSFVAENPVIRTTLTFEYDDSILYSNGSPTYRFANLQKNRSGTWREKTNRYCKRTNTFCSQESYRDIYVSPFVCVSGSEWIIVFQTLSRCSHSPLSLGLKIKLGNEKILATEDEKLISRDDETGRKKRDRTFHVD